MSKDLTQLSAYHYELPEDLIAHHPCEPRDAARLLVVDRASGNFSEMAFRDLADWLKPEDSLVLNDTKVIPARLFGTRPTGGRCEIFLIEEQAVGRWLAMAKPGKKLPVGTKVTFAPDFYCTVVEELPSGKKVVEFPPQEDFFAQLETHGHMPLPLYIRREDEQIDKMDYQTVLARHPGAVAAPTAGLHFTESLLEAIVDKGCQINTVTLHVGPGTFRPVRVEDVREHEMHSERYVIDTKTAESLNNRQSKGRQICVGTTCCRTLEAAAQQGSIEACSEETDIFIYPGYEFRYVQHLLTNFHQPCSTLLMLVSAFAGYELIMEAYQKAIKEKFRFFSYGDAMLIL